MASLRGYSNFLFGEFQNAQTTIQQNATDIQAVQQDVSTAQNDISTIQGDVSTVQGDVSTLQGDVSNAQGDISTLQGDVSTAQQDIQNVEGGVSRREDDLVEVLKHFVIETPGVTGVDFLVKSPSTGNYLKLSGGVLDFTGSQSTATPIQFSNPDPNQPSIVGLVMDDNGTPTFVVGDGSVTTDINSAGQFRHTYYPKGGSGEQRVSLRGLGNNVVADYLGLDSSNQLSLGLDSEKYVILEPSSP